MLAYTLPICALVVCAGSFQAEPPPATGVSADGSAIEALLRHVPQTPEEVQTCIETARRRIAVLEAELEPPVDATDETVEALPSAEAALAPAREELSRAWHAYLDQLGAVGKRTENISRITSDEHIHALTEEVSRIGEETRELGAPLPPWQTEREIEDLEAVAHAVQARVDVLAEEQARRSTLLASGVQQQREQLEGMLDEWGQSRQELDTTDDATDALAGADARHLERRLLDVKIATANVALQTLPLEQQEAELLSGQEGPLLAALRGKLDAINRRAGQLAELRRRTRIDELQDQRAKADTPAEIALIDLQLFVERALHHYFQEPDWMERLQRRFPPEQAEQLRERITWSGAYWERAVESLEYRRGEETLGLQRHRRDEMRTCTVQLTDLRAKLGATLVEAQDLRGLRERALRRFVDLDQQVEQGGQSLDAARRAEFQTEVAAQRARLDEAMRTAVDNLDGLTQRISDAVELVEQHLTRLSSVERRVRWQRITSRDAGLLGADFRTGWRELTALLTPASVREPDGDEAAAALRRELFGDGLEMRGEPGQAVDRAWGWLVGAAPANWGWRAVVLAFLLVSGFVLYRLGRRKGVRLAREIVEVHGHPATGAAPGLAGISARIDLLGWNVLGDLAVPLSVIAALVFGSALFVRDQTIGTLWMMVLGCLAVAIVLWRVVHHLFEAGSAAHRPIPCSDLVARHYRFWLVALTLWSLILLIMPISLGILGVAPALRGVLFEIHKAGFLFLLLLFLVRKERVLGNAFPEDSRETACHHWGFTLAMVVYPLLLLVVSGLLVLEVIGFGDLVSFAGRGLLLTGAVVFAVGTVAEYLADVVQRRPQPAPESARSPRNADRPTGRGPATVQMEQRRPRDVTVLLAWLVRLIGLGGVVILTLRVWDVPVRSEWLNWRLIGLSVLVVLVAVLLDRITFTALRALRGGGRLPESTVNISRRWIRGLLVLFAFLAIVAIAGFEVGSIWQFLTAILAMVAIGFVAVWSMLSNILATLVILIWRPFNVGERVELLPDGVEGEVVDINFIYTILKSEDGAKTAVPNNLFVQKFIRRRKIRAAPERTLAEQLESEKPLGE